MTDTQTLKAAFNRVAMWYPERTAFVQAKGEKRYTFAEADEQACRFANGIASLGVEKGDRVAFLCKTIVDQAIAYFGSQKLGAIPVTVHNREASNVIKSLVEKVEPEVLIFQPEFEKLVQSIRDDIPVNQFVAFDWKIDGPDFARSYVDLVEGSNANEPHVMVDPSDIAFINFSSGTTGHPKPVVHTHDEAIENCHIHQYLFGYDSRDTLLNPFTPSFIAWQNMTLPYMNAGGTTVFMEEWDPKLFLETIDTEHVTSFLLVPTQFKMLLQATPENYNLSSIRLMSYAGEAMSKELFRELNDKVAGNFSPFWGTTEVMSGGLSLPPHEVDEDTLASVGRPLPQIEICIIEPGSREPSATVKSGEIGELIVRGPSVAKEIWRDPKKTEQYFHDDGWWFSGDLGRIGDDGYVYIEGRADNMVITGGINVFPETVEGVIETHNAIIECAIIGVPDEEWGEIIKAYVVTNDISVSIEDLDQWCLDNDNLADYQRPREWKIAKEMPRTNTGKLNRKALREQEGI